MHKIAAFYHPTTLTLVDDDHDFLVGLALALDDHFHCNTFTSPDEVETFFHAHHLKQIENNINYLNITERGWSDLQMDVQINSIYRQVFNPHRFAKYCILIIDYDMPSRNGLDLARALKTALPVKIILLTGEADRETAIMAFNAKEIDRFVSKSEAGYHRKLIRYVQELQRDYFIEQSIAILKSLDIQEVRPLQEPAFIRLFESICEQYGCVEYYLLDESCSFLLLDAEGHETWLILRSPMDMESYFELAEDEDETIQKNILKSLKNHSKLAFLRQGSEGIQPVNQWLFIEAHSLPGTDMFYGLLHGKIGYEKPEKIQTYSEFLKMG